MMPVEELWWRRVPTAERIVKNTRDDLLYGRSVQVFPDMVWKESFIYLVLTKVQNIDAGVADIVFDGASLDQNTSLIDNIAEQLGFGFNFDGTLKTLVEHLQINSGYIWRMQGLCERHLKEAHQMIKELAKQKTHIAVLLEDDTPIQVKSLFQIKLNPTRMDIHYFAWTLLLEQDEVPLLEYAAILCEELCSGDLNRCAILCDRIHDLMKDASSVCDWLTAEELQKAVHIAQLRGIQPVIEEQRLAFIDRLGHRIDRILPFTDEYQSQFTKPQEVELRHLIYYRRDLSLSPEELELLNKLHDARNDLSHLHILTENVVKELAELSGR